MRVQVRLVLAVLACCALVLLGLTAGAGPRPESDSQRPTYPPPAVLRAFPQPAVARPPYLTPMTDPVWGTTVTRVSDRAAFHTSETWLRNTYSKIQPWNSDDSLLLLGFVSKGYLLDGRNYRYLGRTLPNANAGVWSNAHPDVFYAVSGNQLLSESARTGATRVLRTFPEYRSISISNGEGSPSNDDHYLVLLGQSALGYGIVVYDLRKNLPHATLWLGPTGSQLDWAAMSQSGKYVLLSWFANGPGPRAGVDLYDPDLRLVRHLLDASEHGDICYTSAHQESWVTIDYSSGAARNEERILSVPLDGSAPRVMLTTQWVGSQVSCRNLARPGWTYISDDRPVGADRPGYELVYALRLDGSGQIEPFAHAHLSADVPYGWRTMAVPDRTGGRVIFGSDWGLGASQPAYAYVAEAAGSSTR